MGPGRPKKDMSLEAVQKRHLSGERLKMLRQGKIITLKPTAHLTQKKLAAYLDRDVSVLRGYEAGRGIPDTIAEKLEGLTGIIKEYWLGSTDKLTWGEYSAEIAEKNRRLFAINGLDSRVSFLDTERSTFFRVCGYSYEHTPTAFVDFASAIMPPAEETEMVDPTAGSYYITSLSYSDICGVLFTPEEMHALIEKVKDLIAFECSKKLRQQ